MARRGAAVGGLAGPREYGRGRVSEAQGGAGEGRGGEGPTACRVGAGEVGFTNLERLIGIECSNQSRFRERSIRLLASVAHLDRTIARLRESNERFERENKVLLQTITHTDAARNISFLQTPSLTSRPASRTGAASVSSSSSSRDPPDRRSLPSRTTEMDYSQLPPIPTSSIHAPQFPRRTSPSETFSHPVIGSTLPSPITPSSTTTIVSDPPPPLSRKHSQRIKESKSSIFGSAEEPEAGEPAPPAKPEPQPTDELSKDEIMAKMDYFSAQKVRCVVSAFCHVGKPSDRKRVRLEPPRIPAPKTRKSST